MKQLLTVAGIPETLGLAILGAVIGGTMCGAGLDDATIAVLIGGGVGACATSAVFVGLCAHPLRTPAGQSHPS